MKLHSAVFYTLNVDAIEEFYTHTLGLESDYRSGDTFISFLFPNGVKLGIKKAVEEREIPGAQTIFVEVDDIEEWYERAQTNGWSILKHLVEESWATNFSILDPDKNKVQFIQTK